MAFEINPEQYCTGLVRSRIPEEAVLAEEGQFPVTQEIVNNLGSLKDPKARLIEDLGIRITGFGDAEKSNNIPRIFILQQSQQDPAADEVKDLRSAGVPFGSLEFWKEVQKGNVFAYPAGMAQPVQLRLDTSNPELPVFGYSSPIDPDDFPLRERPVPDPAPTKPWGITMWLNKKLGMFQSRVDAYNRRVEAHQAYEQRKNTLRGQIRQQTETRNSNNRLGREVTSAKERLNNIDKVLQENNLVVDIGEPLIKELYGTKPVRRKDFTRDDPTGPTVSNAKYGLSEFNELKPIDLDLNNIKLGSSGVSVDEDDFVALSMLTAMQYKHLKKHLDTDANEADWMINDLKAYEISDPISRRADSVATMVSMDIVRDKNGPRENIGGFFKDIFQPAREEAKTALENYQKAASSQNPEERAKLKEDLGSIIAAGINSAANFSKVQDSLTHQDRLMARKAERLVKLMEHDPELRKIAEEKGMKPEKLKAVKGLAEYDRLAREKELALKELKKAAAYGEPLSDQKKKELAKKIIKANTFTTMYKNGHQTNMKKGDFKRLYDKLMDPDNLTMPPIVKNKANNSTVQAPWRQCPGLKDGKIYYGNPMQKVEMALKIEKMPESEIAVILSNSQGQKWLDDFANSQIDKMNISEMDAESIDVKLENNVNSKSLIDDGAASMLQFTKSLKQPVNNPKAVELNAGKKQEINPNPVPSLG